MNSRNAHIHHFARLILCSSLFWLLGGCSDDGDLTSPTPEVTDDGLVAYYPFNASFNDVSAQANDANPVGAVGFGADRFGEPLSAGRFPGEGHYLRVADSSSFRFAGGRMTVTGWVKAESWCETSSRFVPVLAKEDDVDDPADGSDFEIMFTETDMGFWPYGSQPAAFSLQVWHFFAIVVDVDVIKFYFDGALLGACALDGPFAITDRPLHLGTNFAYQDEYLDGSLDDIRIYDRALSKQEIENAFHE